MKKIISIILTAIFVFSALPASAQEKKIKLGNVFILGDSYSTFEGYMPANHGSFYNPAQYPERSDVTKVEETWWRLLIDNTDSKLVLNSSWSGTAICHTGPDGQNFSGISFAARLDNYIEKNFFVGNKIDTFLLFGGTNDSGFNCPLGTIQYSDWTKEDLFNALPAFSYVLHKVKTELSDTRLVVILNDSIKGELKDNYKIICDYYGVEYMEIPYIDKMTGHPTVVGMKQIYSALMGFFTENPENTKVPQTELETVFRFPFTDVPENAWYRKDVENAYRKGLINGRSLTTFDPAGSMSYSEAIKLAACIHQLHFENEVTLTNGVSPAPWFSTFMEYALKNGIIDTDMSDKAYKKITRQDFAKIFYRSLPESEFSKINEIADNAIPDVKTIDEGAAEIYGFYRAGVLTGSDRYGRFNPTSQITRSEVAAILTRMFDKEARKAITLS